MHKYIAKDDCYVWLKSKNITTFRTSYGLMIYGDWARIPLKKNDIVTCYSNFEILHEFKISECEVKNEQ